MEMKRKMQRTASNSPALPTKVSCETDEPFEVLCVCRRSFFFIFSNHVLIVIFVHYIILGAFSFMRMCKVLFLNSFSSV